MKALLILLLVQVLGTGLNAQKISGLVQHDQHTAVGGASVILLRAQDSSTAKLGATAPDGSFLFTSIANGSYFIRITCVGHTPYSSDRFQLSGSDLALPAISLARQTREMQAVAVTAQRPPVEVKADKTIVNVEGTINSTGNTALELLRKSPGVVLDKDENLSLNGKTGVQVWIDGRPTPLSGDDLTNYLKSTQASQIESIELITNPSARYDAAGNGGIINIKLKKNKAFGTNGSLTGGYNIGVFAKYNGGVSLNHRTAAVNWFGNYNYNNSLNSNQLTIRRTVLDSLFNQQSLGRTAASTHSFKAGADFFLNKQSTLGVIVNGNLADQTGMNRSRTPIEALSGGKTSRILSAENNSTAQRNNISLNTNYTNTRPDGRTLSLNADYSRYKLHSDQLQPNIYLAPNGIDVLSRVSYQMIAPTNIAIYSVKGDYEQGFRKGKLSYGGKLALVHTINDFQRYNVYESGKEADRDRSNRFSYRENINAGYMNYNRAFKGVLVQAGVRVENTISQGTSTGLRNENDVYKSYDSSFRRNYTDVFPSAAVTFNKNPKSQLSLTWSRRIDRPAYQDLNPFEFKLDEYTFQKGNINLRPQYTNSYGVTHTYKFKLNTTLNYSHVKDMFVMLVDTAEGTKAFMAKKNLASQNIFSVNISYPFIYKTYTLVTNVNANYKRAHAEYGPGRTIDVESFGFSAFTQHSLRFAKTWTAELTGFYNAPTVLQSNIRSNGMWSVDAGLQRQLLKGKATLKGAVSDLFHTLRFTGVSNFAGQETRFTSRWESRQAKLSFTYRFGSNTVKAARQRNSGADDEMKRVQASGGIGAQ